MILSLYLHGLSTREIKAHLEEIYGVEVSPDLISSVTEAVSEEVRQWQTRPLETVYPIICPDALWVKIRYDGTVQNHCIYLPIGVNIEGKKEALGLWAAESEGAKFRLQVLTELSNRGFALELFGEKWNSKYPLIAKSWQARWQRISPMFALPKEIRKAVYTTNVIESLNYSLRKITRNPRRFPD